jgi:hypothetical protein
MNDRGSIRFLSIQLLILHGKPVAKDVSPHHPSLDLDLVK